MPCPRIRPWLLACALLPFAACGGESAPAAADAAASTRVDADIDRVLGDHAPYASAYATVRRAVAAHDAKALAALVEYPLATVLDGKPATIADAATFVRDYDRIVTAKIAAVLAAQDYGALSVSDQGLMFGNGELWLNGICRDPACKAVDVRIVRIQPGPD